MMAACKLKNKYKGDGIAIEENGGLLDDGLSITRDSGWYVMDDFTTIASAPPSGEVPEPANPLLLGAGVFALVLGRARRRKAPASAA